MVAVDPVLTLSAVSVLARMSPVDVQHEVRCGNLPSLNASIVRDWLYIRWAATEVRHAEGGTTVPLRRPRGVAAWNAWRNEQDEEKDML